MSAAAIIDQKEHVTCFVCEEQVEKNATDTETVYDSPWSDSRDVSLCEECHLNDDNSEFSYWECNVCNRKICQRNLGNGYQSWFKHSPDDELICCACYQEDRLKNGQAEDDFLPDHTGCHHIQGDFYDDGDLEKAGFAKHSDWRHKKVSQRLAADYCNAAYQMIQNDHKVITQYRNLSIFGDEGYVTMWTKKPEQINKRPRDDDDDESQGSPLKRAADQGDNE